MQVTIEIPNAVAARVANAYAAQFGWDPSTGVTKNAFVKNIIAGWIKEVTKVYEMEIARIAAQDQAATKADAEIAIT